MRLQPPASGLKPYESNKLFVSSDRKLIWLGWVIGALIVLLVIEVLADKIPLVDHVNDLISWIVRPAAGAILFAALATLVRRIFALPPSRSSTRFSPSTTAASWTWL